jgi:predicted nucleotidyltransferase component of viral defense system
VAAKFPDRPLADYRSAEALWAAIDNRIVRLVEADPRLNRSALQRQFGYERFLARIFAIEGDWVLKGGTALLCRTRSARHSLDIDLFRRQGEVTEAVAELVKLAAVDLGDHGEFLTEIDEIREERPERAGARLATIKVVGYVGARRMFEFTVDTVVGSVITTEPDCRVPEPIVHIPGLEPPSFRLYPIVDHVADKLCATFERFGDRSAPSTRVRDLVDLVVIARTRSMEVSALRRAIEAERSHRELPPITEYRTPESWPGRYPKVARGVADCADYPSHANAVELVGRLLDPVLSGQLTDGVWHPDRLVWSSESLLGGAMSGVGRRVEGTGPFRSCCPGEGCVLRRPMPVSSRLGG